VPGGKGKGADLPGTPTRGGGENLGFWGDKNPLSHGVSTRQFSELQSLRRRRRFRQKQSPTEPFRRGDEGGVVRGPRRGGGGGYLRGEKQARRGGGSDTGVVGTNLSLTGEETQKGKLNDTVNRNCRIAGDVTVFKSHRYDEGRGGKDLPKKDGALYKRGRAPLEFLWG